MFRPLRSRFYRLRFLERRRCRLFSDLWQSYFVHLTLDHYGLDFVYHIDRCIDELTTFFNTVVYVSIFKRSRNLPRVNVVPEMSTVTMSTAVETAEKTSGGEGREPRREGTTDIRKLHRSALTVALIAYQWLVEVCITLIFSLQRCSTSSFTSLWL